VEIYASAPISWSSNVWHQVGVEYTGGDCEIYLDGVLAATGDGVMYVPKRSTWTNGFFIGSDNTGYEQARGAFWGMTMWNEEDGAWYTYAWPGVSNAIVSWQGTQAGFNFGRLMGMSGDPGYIAGVTYTTNYSDYTNFWLDIGTSSSATQAVVTIQNTQSNLTYNILTNSVLDPNLADWGVWQTLTATNSVIVAPPFDAGSSSMFFAAQLVLITVTNQIADWWQMEYLGQLNVDPTADPDGDGLSNYIEYMFGSNPTNAYSLDPTHTYKDGQWFLTSVAGQTGTRVEMWMDPYDSYFDPYNDITVVAFALTGVNSNDQFDLYIQTPSVDPTDPNPVWQDMFRFFGVNPGGYVDGALWYQTAWLGYVPLDGTVKFAALDSQDRDSDGLQDGYEVFVTHTIVGAPSSEGNGVADGDADPAQDGFPTFRNGNMA